VKVGDWVWTSFGRYLKHTIYSQLGMSETLRFNVRFTSAAHDRRIKSLNDSRSTKDDKGSERRMNSFQENVEV
jgi:hypothetical protein